MVAVHIHLGVMKSISPLYLLSLSSYIMACLQWLCNLGLSGGGLLILKLFSMISCYFRGYCLCTWDHR